MATEAPVIWTSHSNDGQTWSVEVPVTVGARGQREKRVVWMRQGLVRHWRIQKFRGTSDAHVTIMRLEAKIEVLKF